MKKKIYLAFLMLGLLSITFAIPAGVADTKPAYALNDEDVTGWWLFDEGSVAGVNWSSYDMGCWFQIWINNQSGSNAIEAWLNATKCVCVMIVQFPFTITNFWWNLIEAYFVASGGTLKDVPGYSHAVTWDDLGVYLALGVTGDKAIFILGYGDNSTPADPFTGWWKVKTPTNTDATGGDILSMLTLQGTKFPFIPGFEMLTIFLALVVLTGVVFLLRKDQLHFLKLK